MRKYLPLAAPFNVKMKDEIDQQLISHRDRALSVRERQRIAPLQVRKHQHMSEKKCSPPQSNGQSQQLYALFGIRTEINVNIAITASDTTTAARQNDRRSESK